MSSKTQKNREPKTKAEIKSIWDSFEKEDASNAPIECVYDHSVNIEFCKLCSSSLAFNDEHLMTCTNTSCGIIYTNIVDDAAEWRFYGNSDNPGADPTRCGMPVNPLLEQSSYGCKILCTGKATYEMRKIRRYTAWQSMPYREKSNYDDFQRIIAMSGNAGIPKLIIDEALRYHKNIVQQKTFRGINRDGIIAASIYIACRVNDHPRTPKELATIFNLDNTSATKGCKNAIKILNSFESQMDQCDKTTFSTTKPEAFIGRFCSKLNINAELTKLCQFITMRIEQKNLVPEKAPQSVAAGIIYFVAQTCGINITKGEIHIVSEISEVTINKCYKKLETYKEELIPKVILDKYGN
jgi:transcription initiation factor TFIIB